MELDYCQYILQALGSFDYTAANKLVYKLMKASVDFLSFSFVLTFSRYINQLELSLLVYVTVKVRLVHFSFYVQDGL